MNKKGFTLVELLTVIVMLAALSIIAIPNVINIVNNNKKDVILGDAQKLVSLAKYKISTDSTTKENCSTTCDLSISVLNTNGDIGKDPEGSDYLSTSFVRYTKTNGISTYCVYLEGSKHILGTTSNCINEDNLFNRNVVIEK